MRTPKPSLAALFSTLLCLSALVAAPADVAAQDEPAKVDAAVLNLESADVEAGLLDTLTSVLRNEAQQYPKYAVVNQTPVNLSEILVVLGCNTANATCLKQAAEQLDARILIFGRVERAERTLRVTVQIFDASQGKTVQRFVRSIPDQDDPVVAFRREAESLFQSSQTQSKTRLQIGSNVDGATIKVEDTVIGEAPLERKGLPPGDYVVEVFAEGYEPWQTTVELTEGADVRLWAPLSEVEAGEDAPVAAAAPAGAPDEPADGLAVDQSAGPPETIDGGMNWGPWSAIGVGAVLLAGSGVMALLINGTEDDLIDHDAQRNDMSLSAYKAERQEIIDRGQTYETAHQILLGAGAVAVVTGAVWLFLDDGAEAQAADGLAVGVGPSSASATYRW